MPSTSTGSTRHQRTAQRRGGVAARVRRGPQARVASRTPPLEEQSASACVRAHGTGARAVLLPLADYYSTL